MINKNHQPFFDSMESLGLPIPDDYLSSDLWKIFKAGYNAAVEVANQEIKDRYKIRKTAPKIFK